jgi:hypothetical protein
MCRSITVVLCHWTELRKSRLTLFHYYSHCFSYYCIYPIHLPPWQIVLSFVKVNRPFFSFSNHTCLNEIQGKMSTDHDATPPHHVTSPRPRRIQKFFSALIGSFLHQSFHFFFVFPCLSLALSPPIISVFKNYLFEDSSLPLHCCLVVAGVVTSNSLASESESEVIRQVCATTNYSSGI